MKSEKRDPLDMFEADVSAVRAIMKKYATLSPAGRLYLAQLMDADGVQRPTPDPELKIAAERVMGADN